MEPLTNKQQSKSQLQSQSNSSSSGSSSSILSPHEITVNTIEPSRSSFPQQIKQSAEAASMSSISHSGSGEVISNSGSGVSSFNNNNIGLQSTLARATSASSSSVGSRTKSGVQGSSDRGHPELAPESSIYSIPSPSHFLTSRPPTSGNSSSSVPPPSIMPVTYGRNSPLSSNRHHHQSHQPRRTGPSASTTSNGVTNVGSSGSTTPVTLGPHALAQQSSINSVVSGLTADSGRSVHSQGSSANSHQGSHNSHARIPNSPTHHRAPSSINNSGSNPGTPRITKRISMNFSTRASVAGSIVRHDSLLPETVTGAEDSISGGGGTAASIIPTSLDQFTDYDFQTVRQRLTWTYELPEGKLRDEYNAFYHEKTSLGLLFFSSIIMAFAVLPCTATIFVNALLQVYTYGNQSTHMELGKLALGIVGLSLSLGGTVVGFYLDYLYRHRIQRLWHDLWRKEVTSNTVTDEKEKKYEAKNDHSARIDSSLPVNADAIQKNTTSEGNPSLADIYEDPATIEFVSKPQSAQNPSLTSTTRAAKKSLVDDFATWKQNQLTRKLRHFYVFAFEIIFLIAVIHRVILTPDCHHVRATDFADTKRQWIMDHLASPTFMGAGLCSEFMVKPSAVIGNTFGMVFILFVFVTHFPDLNMKLVWSLLWLIAIVSVICSIIIEVYDPIIIVPSITYCVGLVFSDIQTRNIVVFLTTRKLKNMITENERLAAETHANEMRHMIANVAHDLKTPLSSFTTGVDLIQLSFSEIYHSIGNGENAVFNAQSLKESLHTIQLCINNIRNTNSFMLMTINRCIDYTKATKGVKLVPRYETIDLQETLQLPLSCMINIQNRIEIKLKQIDMSNICSHIITDKQWLQENVLCLLSNAVKYSSEGSVTISVFLETEREMILENTSDASNILDTKDIPIITGVDDQSLDRQDGSDEPALLLEARSSSINVTNPDVSITRPTPVKRGASAVSVVSSVSFETLDHFNLQSSVDRKGSRYHKESELPRHDKVFLRIEVEDTGIGMSDEAMASLFNAFKQTQRLAGGTGLGLFSLAKRVEAMNGLYGVMRRRDGTQGSLFWFAIPYRPDEEFAKLACKEAENAAKLELYVSRSHSVESIMASKMKIDNKPPPILILSSSSSSASAAATPEGNNIGSGKRMPGLIPSAATGTPVGTPAGTPVPQSSKATKRLKILLVDDSPAIIKMTGMMLKRMGHHITTAENGAMAVKAAIDHYNSTNSTFDVILMDLQMPVMDGLEATRRIRDFELRQCPIGIHHLVVGMSANSDSDTMDEAFASNIDLFIPKPFNMNTFNEKVMSRCLASTTVEEPSGRPPIPFVNGPTTVSQVATRDSVVKTLAASTETEGDEASRRITPSVVSSLSFASSEDIM